jgi:DNA-binding PadR family transcriptional regulator
MSRLQLTPTSYVVLGLLAREGPSTPYDLKRHVAATLGHFWTFPHALLYSEPPSLVSLGLATEQRENDGRHRRVFSITDRGRDVLRTWLSDPATDPTQLRDPGLLQLFFSDLGDSDARGKIATQQLASHRERLAEYQSQGDDGHAGGPSMNGTRTSERWRGETLRMGIAYERAAISFWDTVIQGAGPSTTETS